MRYGMLPQHAATAMIALLLPACLGGCSHVPLTTVYKLATFDPVQADPAVIRAALRYPDALTLRKDGARLTLTLQPAGGTTPRRHEFTLVVADGPGDREPRLRYARDGDVVEVMRLSDADVATVRELQAEPHGAGGRLEVSAAACHRGGLPAGPILTSTFLRLAIADGYMTVLEDFDLRHQLSAEKLAAEVPPCPAEPPPVTAR